MVRRTSSPSLRRRRLVSRLVALRVDAGFDIGDAAERAGFSQSKLSRIESLDVSVSGDDTDTLCQVYGVDDETRHALVSLARQAKRKGWWQVFPSEELGVSTDLLELEDDSTQIRSYTDALIPGFVQTFEYACAVIGATSPMLDRATVEYHARVRMERQQRLRDRGVERWLIVDEYALRRNIGGPSTMAAMIESLIDAANDPSVSIQILPQDLSEHVALGMPFKLMTLRDGARFVHAETLGGGLYLEADEQVANQEDRWSKLAAQALSFVETTTQLGRIAQYQRSRTHDQPGILRVAQE